jgi:hypothetical protein
MRYPQRQDAPPNLRIRKGRGWIGMDWESFSLKPAEYGPLEGEWRDWGRI